MRSRRKAPQKGGLPRHEAASARSRGYRQAARELGDMMRETGEVDFPGERRRITADEMAEDLNLVGRQKARARDMISEIAKDTRNILVVTKDIQREFKDRYLAAEIIRRGVKLYRQSMRKGFASSLEYAEAIQKGDTKSPSGFVDFGSKISGGKRKPDPHGGFQYWYPGKGIQNAPHDDDHDHHHEAHEDATPSADVKAEYAEIKALAEKNGIEIGAVPRSAHDMEAMKGLRSNVEAAIKRMKSKPEGGKEKKEEKPEAKEEKPAEKEEKPEAKTEAKEEEKEAPEPAEEEEGEAEGEDESNVIRPDVDQWGQYEGHDVPESAHEIAYLQSQVDELKSLLSSFEDRMESYHQPMYDQLHKDAAAVRKSPSKQALHWFAEQLASFITVIGAAVTGAMVGGPVGAILGAAFGMHANRQRQIANAIQQQQYQKSESGLFVDKSTGRLVFKAGGPYIGPRGGKWKDAQHKVPWTGPMRPRAHAHHHGALHGDDIRALEAHISERMGDNPPPGKKVEIPLTFDETGTHIVVVTASTNPARAKASRSADGKGGYVEIEVNAGHPVGGSRLLGLLAHEIAHAADPDLIGKAVDTHGLHDEQHATHWAERKPLRAEASIWLEAPDVIAHGRYLMEHGTPWGKNPLSKAEAANEMLDMVPTKRPVTQAGLLPEMHAYAMKLLESKLSKAGPYIKSGGPYVKKSALPGLSKGGPFIGPRGGKWQDAKHTIPWKDEKHRHAGKTHTVYPDDSSKKKQPPGRIGDPKLGKLLGWSGGKVTVPHTSGIHDTPLSHLEGVPVQTLDTTNTGRIKEARREGKKIPPIVVEVTSDGRVQLVDGHHRLAVARKEGDASIAVKWHLRKSSAVEKVSKALGLAITKAMTPPGLSKGGPDLCKGAYVPRITMGEAINRFRQDGWNLDHRDKAYKRRDASFYSLTITHWRHTGGSDDHFKVTSYTGVPGSRWHVQTANTLKDAVGLANQAKVKSDDIVAAERGESPKGKGAKSGGGPFIGKRGGKWADAAHTIPWKKSAVALRSRHPVNEHGHRDDLIPGTLLSLRKTHINADSDSLVEVGESGTFKLGDNTFKNGNMLLKSLYGRKDHKLTIRRYFGLGTEQAKETNKLMWQLRDLLSSEIRIAKSQRNILLAGPLSQHVPAVYLPEQYTEHLSLEPIEAEVLIEALNGEANGKS